MLRWLIRLASVFATGALAAGWGRFATSPSWAGGLFLAVLTLLVGAALQRLYREGGPAAFEPHAPEEPGPAPLGPAPPTPAPSPPPRRPARTSGALWSSHGGPAASEEDDSPGR